jgi:hypothetical protein
MSRSTTPAPPIAAGFRDVAFAGTGWAQAGRVR